MRREYAIQGVAPFKHWSDAYPTLEIARKAANDLAREGRSVEILMTVPSPSGYEIGAYWMNVETIDGL